MLTKDLLISTKRSGRIYPKFLDPNDKVYLELAATMIGIFERYAGHPHYKIKELVSDVHSSSEKVKQGFEKLLVDGAEFTDEAASIEDFRWDVLKAAQTLREESSKVDIRDYLSAVAERFTTDIGDLQSKLYSDLPDYKRLQLKKPITALQLVERYNLAQVQGLVIRASRITITIRKVSLTLRRALFRALKFQQLLIDDVKETDTSLSFQLAGPLSIFSMAQTYGLKFANFLPYVVQLENYEIDATIKLADKSYALKIDQKSGLRSHYQPLKAYVPQELADCIQRFNDKYPDYQAEPGNSLLDLGMKSYCFPDIEIRRKDSKSQPVYVELFHRWHFGQLEGRLASMARSSSTLDLRIGMCRSIEKKAELAKLKEGSELLRDRGFDFKSFPTPKQLLTAIQ